MSDLSPYYVSPQTDAQGGPRATLYCGDCREIAPSVEGVGAVVSDPPYGMKWDGRVTRGPNGTGKVGPTRHHGRTIKGDAEPFDPSQWLEYPRVILWGSNHYATRLPVGTTLVWIKRYASGFGSFLSDAEIGWMKRGHGVYCYRDMSLQGQSSDRHHPTQKPVGLMEWCITERAKVPLSDLILDPYMGSGTTGVACAKTGHRFVGIEIEERYCEIAAKRIDAALSQAVLFPPSP